MTKTDNTPRDSDIVSEGNTLIYDAVNDGFFNRSPLEALIHDSAEQSDSTPFEFGYIMFRLGLLDPFQPGLIASSSGAGDIEVYNGTMTVGDVAFLGDDKDIVLAVSGNDFLFAGAGADIIFGGDGDDFLVGGSGSDKIFGGAGIDTVSYLSSASGVQVDLSTRGPQNGDHGESDILRGVENVLGSAYDDMLTGTDESNIIHAGTGADTLFGGGGDDVLALGWDPAAPDPARVVGLERDAGRDVVVASASFAENGSDTVFEYFDVAGRADIIDLSDAFDFSDTTQTKEAQLSDAFQVDTNSASGAVEIQDASGNVWFTVYEDRDGRNQFADPEDIYVEVDGAQFEWDVFGDASGWVEI